MGIEGRSRFLAKTTLLGQEVLPTKVSACVLDALDRLMVEGH